MMIPRNMCIYRYHFILTNYKRHKIMSSGSNSADGAVFVMKIVSQTVAMINSYLNAFYRITI